MEVHTGGSSTLGVNDDDEKEKKPERSKKCILRNVG